MSEPSGPLRIEIVLEISPDAIVAVDGQILHDKRDKRRGTKARMALLTPIVDQHMMALAKAVGDAASGDTMEVVARWSASPPDEPTPVHRGGTS